MEKLFKNTFAILFLLVLTSFTIPATVYICLSPGGKSSYSGLKNGGQEGKVVSKGAVEGEYGLKD